MVVTSKSVTELVKIGFWSPWSCDESTFYRFSLLDVAYCLGVEVVLEVLGNPWPQCVTVVKDRLLEVLTNSNESSCYIKLKIQHVSLLSNDIEVSLDITKYLKPTSLLWRTQAVGAFGGDTRVSPVVSSQREVCV